MNKLGAAKASLIRKVKSAKSLAVVRQLDRTLSFAGDDWWESLPAAVKRRLEESDAQIARGETIPHAEVMTRRWVSR